MTDPTPISIIGAGLAGSEAAWQLARRGHRVRLHEMRPTIMTPAHQTGGCAELVCSNSFRSDDAETNAVGLIHQELRRCGSLILASADAHQVPAGGALAVDRDRFSDAVTAALEAEPLIERIAGEVTALPTEGPALIATGPLTGSALAADIAAATGQAALAFFDAIAPIVHRDSINFDVAWFQSRYDKIGPGGTGKDYINCPMDRDRYEAFIAALLAAETTEFKDWEKDTPYFEGCLPVEVMAARGPQTLRHGPLKPVGLTDPRTGKGAYAVVQLRQDNALATLFNIVGFQTKMRWGAQKDVLRMIPGLEQAEFARLGGIHRNTFLNSPTLLDASLRLKARPHLRFAGQITGCEGYVESTAIGLLAALFIDAEIRGTAMPVPPPTTALGALLAHITGGADAQTYQPMNINFGLFPPVGPPPGKRKLKGVDRKRAYTDRARADIALWLVTIGASDAGVVPAAAE